MKLPSSVKELCEFMWSLENKYNLLDFKIQGVKPWQLNRMGIYYALGQKFDIFDKNGQKNFSRIEKIKSLGGFLKNAIIFNPLKNLNKVEYLIFSHSRSKKVNNEYIDIYTHYFISDLLNNNKTLIELEEPYKGKHIRNFKNYKRYLDYVMLTRILKSKFINIKLNNFQNQILNSLDKEIGNYIDIRYNLLQSVKNFLVTYPVYKKILQKTKPKELYIVVSYGKGEIIKAAKELGIKTIELQHGTFSKYHLGYSYPNYQGKLDYFPDEFWVWNKYWKNIINFPISKENIKIYPFKYLENLKQNYKNIQKKKNQIIIIGQDGLSDKIASKILENLEYFNKFELVFKLHPNEYGNINLYKNLLKLKDIKKIKIVEDADLYQLFAESEYQAGVFSTALYEGIEFGCKTILFNLPGIEYMDKFIKMNKNIVVI